MEFDEKIGFINQLIGGNYFAGLGIEAEEWYLKSVRCVGQRVRLHLAGPVLLQPHFTVASFRCNAMIRASQ
jgi:hypothetical protein